MDESSQAGWLRAQPALIGTAAEFDLETLPEDPVELFVNWIRAAAEAGVAEPHAATLATVGADGVPDARTLILKDVSGSGWAVAGQRSSRKGGQLTANPAAALNFWWQPVVRAVRVRGSVREGTRAECEADLAARPAAAPGEIPPDEWMLWWVQPTRVEFWQGSPDRRHLRVVYTGAGTTWSRDIHGGRASPVG